MDRRATQTPFNLVYEGSTVEASRDESDSAPSAVKVSLSQGVPCRRVIRQRYAVYWKFESGERHPETKLETAASSFPAKRKNALAFARARAELRDV